MKRKFFFAFILTLLLGLLFCGVALAEHYSGTCGDHVTWDYDTHVDTLFIEGTGEMYDYYSFNEIPWYDIRTMFTKVVIENGVTGIGRNAFLDCIDVTKITMPSSVTSIGDMAFRGCLRLTGITIPVGVTGIGDYAFRGCSALAGIIIPVSVQSIGQGAFYDCASLTKVTIVNENAVIGNDEDNIFRDCPQNLTICGMPNSTAQAYANKFNIHWEPLDTYGKCGPNVNWSLNYTTGSLTITGSGPMYSDLTGYPFSENDAVLSVATGNGVTSIGKNALYSCRNLQSVSIAPTITEIGEYAFASCGGLTSISNSAGGIQIIRSYAFADCVSLKSIILHDTVNTIGSGAFSGCSKLNSVTIEGRSVTISDDAFRNCSIALTIYGWIGSEVHEYTNENGIPFIPLDEPEIKLPVGLTTIETDAFTNIGALSVYIPSSVTSIVGDPFLGSDVEYIYGKTFSAASDFASTYGYIFVPYDD